MVGLIALKKTLVRRHLTDPEFAFLLGADTTGERAALAVSSEGGDPASVRLTGLCAMRIRGQVVLGGSRLELELTGPEAVRPGFAARELARFVGARPLVGYSPDTALDLIDRILKPEIGIGLPNRRHDVSALYQDHKPRPVRGGIDLGLESILADLELPVVLDGRPCSDALAAALIYLKLRG